MSDYALSSSCMSGCVSLYMYLTPFCWIVNPSRFSKKKIDFSFLFPVPVRVVGPYAPYAGRLEVFLYGRWGTVCDDFFDPVDASYVLRTWT